MKNSVKEQKIELRRYEATDCQEVTALFYQTVHVDYQRKGIATILCQHLEQITENNITTQASITARPFFEKRGYRVVRKQQVKRQDVFLTNFWMEKQIIERW